ncbi:MAG: amidohydrolase family protein [Brevefilum sp.]
MNPARDIKVDAALAISGGKIIWIGDKDEALRLFRPAQSLDLSRKVVIPGLINVHGHWPMTLFRGLVDDCTLEDWLSTIWKVEAGVISEENVVTGAQLAMLEMIQSGTTCAADMYWHYVATTEASREAGFRLVNGPSFADIEGFEDYRNTTQHIAIDYLDEYRNVPLVHPCIQAHSVYMTNPDMLELVKEIAHERKLPFITHASESKGELELVREKYGKTPIEFLDEAGLLGDRTLLAHCVHLSEEEINRLAETGTSVAHCPSSNLKLASGIARVAEMVEQGVNVAIGTDGAASNNDLDLFLEAHLAAMLQKGVTGDPSVLPAEKVFSMLTIDGARAVGLSDKIGSLEVGKLADLAILDFDVPNLTPCYDYFSHLIYAASGANVSHVMVEGQWLMRDREMMTLDEAAILSKTREIARTIRRI